MGLYRYRRLDDSKLGTPYHVGFINKKEELVIPCQYAYYYSLEGDIVPSYVHFPNDLGARAMTRGLISVHYRSSEGAGPWTGYIDAQGNIVYRSDG